MRPLRARRLASTVALVALVALTSLFTAGCPCSPTVPILEDFEGCAAPCGFALSGPGTAAVVTTLHPGEHGLELKGEVTATKTLQKSATIDDTYILSLVADCPSGFEASLSITPAGGEPQTLMVPLELDQTLSSTGDLPDYSGALYLPLNAPVTLPAGVKSADVRALVLHAAAGAPCTVDVIKLSSAALCPG